MRKPKAPAANRARILAAAIDEFASRGFKGASMDAIAARTHTTRALINYYFGGKEKVYLAVLEHVYAEIRAGRGPARPRPPARRWTRSAASSSSPTTTTSTHEGFVRLVVAENQARGPPPEEIAGDAHAQPADHRHARRRHRARPGATAPSAPDIDPVDVHMAIAALGMFNVTNQHTFARHLPARDGREGRRAPAPRNGDRHDSQLPDESLSR